MRHSRLVSLLSVVGLLLGLMVVSVGASSHREAPLIANDPQADHTDLYAFVDPANPGMLNILTAVYPFEVPPGFPNGYTFADEVLYTINIDNTGDGVADKSYGFDFDTMVRFQGTFYSNLTLQGDLVITSPDDPDLNIAQTYTVTKTSDGILPVRRARNAEVMAEGLFTSPNNIGPKSTPNFQDTFRQAVHDLPGGGRVWAGQADDPFFADLGALWDLANLRDPGIDALADMNVQVIALQVPFEEVTANGAAPSDPADPNAAIGIWASNYRQSTKVLRTTVTSPVRVGMTEFDDSRPMHKGAWVQVSRLGMPLSNEVIIPLADKDRWNRTLPSADEQYVMHYENSHLAVLLNTLFGTPGPATDRQDIVTIFLTGIPGLTRIGENPEPADMLRINLAAASGFPNGRLLTDDVVDVSLSVVGLNDGNLEGEIVTSGLSDGVGSNDRGFMAEFPFVALPHEGFRYNPDAGDD